MRETNLRNATTNRHAADDLNTSFKLGRATVEFEGFGRELVYDIDISIKGISPQFVKTLKEHLVSSESVC